MNIISRINEYYNVMIYNKLNYYNSSCSKLFKNSINIHILDVSKFKSKYCSKEVLEKLYKKVMSKFFFQTVIF